MAPKLSLIIFSLLIVNCCAEINLKDLIGQVFRNKTAPPEETTTQNLQPQPAKIEILNRAETGSYKSCGVGKECVPRRLCIGGAISTTGESMFDVRQLISEVCTLGQVCCDIPKNEKTTTQSLQPQPSKTAVLNRVETGIYKSCGVEMECVPRHLCIGGAISTTGENMFNVRQLTGEVCTLGQVCCKILNKRNESVNPLTPKQQHKGCGWRNNDGFRDRIASNTENESEFAEFPWMIAVIFFEETGAETTHVFTCGGSLIAPNVVLTAAHCLKDHVAKTLFVRGGEWDTQSRSEPLGHVDKFVKEIVIHEKFYKGTLVNDIALLILEEPFEWQENIGPICLPDPNANFDHSRCYVTGWGKTKFGRKSEYQVILKKVDLPVVPNDICQTQLRQTRLGFHFILDESFMCAGGEKDKDACKGDGGSPLVCPIPGAEGRYTQVGIVAAGIECALENIPGVYANVPYLRSWISEKLTARGIQFSYFTP